MQYPIRHATRFVLAGLAVVASLALIVIAEDEHKELPQLQNSEYTVHDMTRPKPVAVTPGEAVGEAPADAIVLFDGKDLSNFVGKNGSAPTWKVTDGYMEVTKKSGDLRTKQSFGDMQLHVEFATPAEVKGDGQGRGNSGVFIMDRYEVQVLDNYDNETYADGYVGSVYGQHPPLVNASRKPGQWQSYDIIFTRPRFDDDGKVTTPAYVTVLLNGIVVQNHTEFYGPTTHAKLTHYTAHGDKAPIHFQDHGNPTRYRNIWVRELE